MEIITQFISSSPDIVKHVSALFVILLICMATIAIIYECRHKYRHDIKFSSMLSGKVDHPATGTINYGDNKNKYLITNKSKQTIIVDSMWLTQNGNNSVLFLTDTTSEKSFATFGLNPHMRVSVPLKLNISPDAEINIKYFSTKRPDIIKILSVSIDNVD